MALLSSTNFNTFLYGCSYSKCPSLLVASFFLCWVALNWPGNQWGVFDKFVSVDYVLGSSAAWISFFDKLRFCGAYLLRLRLHNPLSSDDELTSFFSRWPIFFFSSRFVFIKKWAYNVKLIKIYAWVWKMTCHLLELKLVLTIQKLMFFNVNEICIWVTCNGMSFFVTYNKNWQQ